MSEERVLVEWRRGNTCGDHPSGAAMLCDARAQASSHAPLAQLAEQLTLNQRVGGSSPSRRTTSGNRITATARTADVEIRFRFGWRS